ncbi:MAG: hypothetical protein EOP45_13230, partial [Sphingobacteriaceae bacterium]
MIATCLVMDFNTPSTFAMNKNLLSSNFFDRKATTFYISFNSKSRLLLKCFLFFIAFSTVSLTVKATTYTVSTLSDSGTGSLRQAVLNSNSSSGGDVIVFDPDLSGTISFGSIITIADDLTINGNGNIILDGQGQYSIFEVSDNSSTLKTIVIRGLILQNGKSSAGTDYTGTGGYGGISCRENLSLENVKITSCTGGLLFGTKSAAVNTPNLSVTNCIFTSNLSKNALSTSTATSSVNYIGNISINNCVFDNNTGAVFIGCGTSIAIKNTSFTNNSSTLYGGALYINNQSNTSLTSVLLENITA